MLVLTPIILHEVLLSKRMKFISADQHMHPCRADLGQSRQGLKQAAQIGCPPQNVQLGGSIST